MGKFRRHIRQHRNHAYAPAGKERYHLPIFTGIYVKIPLGLLHQLQCVRDVAHCVFHPNNMLHFPIQRSRGCRLNPAPCPAWDIVHNNWDIHMLCNLNVMSH